MNRFFRVAGFVASLVFAPVLGQAQTDPAGPAYTGPRYPGGPDSLRALVFRSVRLASPRPAGRIVLKFELTDGIQPSHFELVPPPGPPNPALLQAAAAATEYLQAHMLAWQAGAPDPKLPSAAPKLRLLLDYNAPSVAQPYAYADQNPSAPNEAALAKVQKKKKHPVSLDYSAKSLITYIQKEVKYPPLALRQGQQGVAYVYVEIAENGTVERPAIVGSISESLDTEILRAISTLPAATVPALVQGRPVRVYYVLPITFIIQ
ncbi:energy transducer TonB [Hymenobacter armeniacus]|uniref:Energy transducer TonB n=1 Tax=Hymenobacter armeniacus TaxID=2771358 RepID=A0ABR8JXP1_9BACT|nr:energy transducer TonB [Hymenobacter armeniacus]MBD2724658.1 energy transducer TonB [Hymenobacter armeniacus]